MTTQVWFAKEPISLMDMVERQQVIGFGMDNLRMVFLTAISERSINMDFALNMNIKMALELKNYDHDYIKHKYQILKS